MITITKRTVLLAATLACGCVKADEPEPASPAPIPVPIAGEEGRYLLDFSITPEGGPTPLGEWTNVAFTTDLSQPVRRITTLTPPQEYAPGVVMTTDRARCGSPPAALEARVRDMVGAGHVDLGAVDVEVVPQDGTLAESQRRLGVCAGVRRGTEWVWYFDVVPFVAGADGHARAHLTLDERAVDAVKLVFQPEPFNRTHFDLVSVKYDATPAQ